MDQKKKKKDHERSQTETATVLQIILNFMASGGVFGGNMDIGNNRKTKNTILVISGNFNKVT